MNKKRMRVHYKKKCESGVDERQTRGESVYLFKVHARIILPSAISQELREFKQRLTLKEKLCNHTPKVMQEEC